MDCLACGLFTNKIGRHLSKHQHVHQQKTTSWHREHIKPFPWEELISYLNRDVIGIVRKYLPELFTFQACRMCYWSFQYITSTAVIRTPQVHQIPPAYYAQWYRQQPLLKTPALFPGDVIELPPMFTFRNPESVDIVWKHKATQLMNVGVISKHRCVGGR